MHTGRIRRQLTQSRNRYHLFTNRFANDWNCIPQEIIDEENINILTIINFYYEMIFF
jgi:hypothetical protein